MDALGMSFYVAFIVLWYGWPGILVFLVSFPVFRWVFKASWWMCLWWSLLVGIAVAAAYTLLVNPEWPLRIQ